MGYAKSNTLSLIKAALIAVLTLLLLTVLVLLSEPVPELIRISNLIIERIEALGVWGPVLFILLYIPAVIFFIPASPISIAGGILFGFPMASIYVVIGALLGGLAAFTIARYVEGGRVSDFLKKRDQKYYGYYRVIDKHGITAILLLHFTLVIPFAGINYLLGITKISYKNYLIGSLIGLIPGSVFYTYFGYAVLEMGLYEFAILSLLLIGLVILSLILRKYLYKE